MAGPRKPGWVIGLFATTLISGPLQAMVFTSRFKRSVGACVLLSTPVFAFTPLATMRADMSVGERLMFDYEMQVDGWNLLALCGGTPGRPDAPPIQTACHGPALCGRKLKLTNGDELDFG